MQEYSVLPITSDKCIRIQLGLIKGNGTDLTLSLIIDKPAIRYSWVFTSQDF